MCCSLRPTCWKSVRALMLASVQHRPVYSTYIAVPHPKHVSVPHNPTLHCGNKLEHMMACFKQPGLLLALSLSPLLRSVTALRIAAGCVAPAGQLVASCTNRPFPSPVAIMMFIELCTHPRSCIFHGPALQRQCRLLIKQTKPGNCFCSLLQLIITLLSLQQAWAAATPLVTSHRINWEVVCYLCSGRLSD